MLEPQFSEIINLIKRSRNIALRTINKELIDLYWNIGEYISSRIVSSEWGQSIVKQLADYIQRNEPQLKGFSDKNLWRMKQFYENYKDLPKLSALLREVSWTNNLIILSRTRTPEEKEFYLQLCKRENYSSRELDRQINSSFFECSFSENLKVSAVLREMHGGIESNFRDQYVFEFLPSVTSYKCIPNAGIRIPYATS